MKKPIADLIKALHQPDGWKSPMVYSVWEDGEITLEKGGEIFGKRNLHQIYPPLADNAGVPKSFMPIRDGLYSRAYVANEQAALTIRNAIAEWHAAHDASQDTTYNE